MPEDSKKNSKKGKNEPKDQRKPRPGRHQAAPPEKKTDKFIEDVKAPIPEKPKAEEPGPEFYKNLKRETDEILKISEEANSKYKKKEILSNWKKYEMPIESYDEIEEQENMGADYEKLIQTPLSIGGHFQFKHEKSWDITTGPSLYDKYFEIDMQNLCTALCTIPFYERNNVDRSVFSEHDILTMDNRATRFKQKYYNDKTFSTPETETFDKLLNTLRDNDDGPVVEDTDSKSVTTEPIDAKATTIQIAVEENIHKVQNTEPPITDTKNVLTAKEISLEIDETSNVIDHFDDILENKKEESKPKEVYLVKEDIILESQEKLPTKVNPPTTGEPKQPVIESPEDLEKWLDDFLDG